MSSPSEAAPLHLVDANSGVGADPMNDAERRRAGEAALGPAIEGAFTRNAEYVTTDETTGAQHLKLYIPNTTGSANRPAFALVEASSRLDPTTGLRTTDMSYGRDGQRADTGDWDPTWDAHWRHTEGPDQAPRLEQCQRDPATGELTPRPLSANRSKRRTASVNTDRDVAFWAGSWQENFANGVPERPQSPPKLGRVTSFRQRLQERRGLQAPSSFSNVVDLDSRRQQAATPGAEAGVGEQSGVAYESAEQPTTGEAAPELSRIDRMRATANQLWGRLEAVKNRTLTPENIARAAQIGKNVVHLVMAAAEAGVIASQANGGKGSGFTGKNSATRADLLFETMARATGREPMDHRTQRVEAAGAATEFVARALHDPNARARSRQPSQEGARRRPVPVAAYARDIALATRSLAKHRETRHPYVAGGLAAAELAARVAHTRRKSR